MLFAIFLAVTAAADDAGTSSWVSDSGYALDAGPVGQVVDRTNLDAGEKPTAAAISPHVTVNIVGAQVQPSAVYLEALRLPAKARPDEATAELVRSQLQAYLQRMGYELANVSARVTDDGIEAVVDEGKIDRLIFLGQLSFQQLRFKLALTLPYGVFNRDLLDRQVRALSEELHTPGVVWELVRTTPVAHDGPQVTALPKTLDLSVAGTEMVHERRPYEVRISFPANTGSFVGLDIRAYYIDGIELGLNYTGRSLIAEGDRWYVGASGGVGARFRIGTSDLYPYFSRAAFEASYTTPKLFKYFRPSLWTATSVVNRQRPDLNLEAYWAFTVDAALQLELEVRTGLRVAVAAGYDYRVFFGFESPPPAESVYDGRLLQNQRPFIRLLHESVINPHVLRWDRRHTIESEFRFYFPFRNTAGLGVGDVRYQYVKEFGWHDFWIKGHGHLSFGDVTFHDEISVGEFVRGIYTAQWVPTAASILLEFRFSLVRDTIKIGAFYDLGVFAMPLRDQPPGNVQAEWGTGFGPTVSLLVLDMFQVDMFVGFGIRPARPLNVGFGLILNKAF